MARPWAVLTAGLLCAACGDPVSIVGDIPGIMRIVAGMPDTPGKTAEEFATQSRLDEPAGLALDGDGVLHVADRRNSRIVSVRSNGRLRVLVDDGFCTVETGPCIERPSDVALDGAGGLVVADPVEHRVWRIRIPGGGKTVLAGTGERGDAPDGAAARTAPLSGPWGVAVGPDGSVYVSESQAARVRVIRPDGSLGTFAGTGEPGFAGDGGPAAEARLDTPLGLTIREGVLYVADAGNDRVRSIDLASGVIGSVAGNGVRGFAGDGGPALGAALNVPEDISVTPDGRLLYIADTRNHRVRVVDLRAGLISTFAGDGTTAFSGDLRDAGATALRLPAGVAATEFGLLFIADSGHEIVWRTAIDF